jgi:hypothetical protein
MEIKLDSPGLDDKGYFKYAEEISTFFQVMRNPSVLSPQEINKARSWLLSLVVVPDGKQERAYKNKAKKLINSYTFNELIDLVSTKESEPDPK